MAIQGATQALIAAFTFGIVVNAASAALFLFTRGHGSSIFRDGLRLVLITFLLTSALWAQIDFITTVIDTTTGTTSCQLGLIFSTLFDQLGRFSLEQYLLWAMVTPGKVSVGQMIAQLLIAGRFVVGAVFVGFTRPQTDTFCVARSSVMPVAFTVIALDGTIIVALVTRAFMTGLVADIQEGKASSSRSKSIFAVMVGFVIWSATSVTMMLGMTSLDLIFRTAVPAIGLSILIIIVTACSGELASPRESPSRPPEAPSPRRINISRDISSADSSEYPPSRYEDLKEQAIRSSTAFLQPRDAPKAFEAFEDPRGLPKISRPITGIAGVGGLPVQGVLFPPTRAETVPIPEQTRKVSITELKQKKSRFGRSPAPVGKLTIGNPILQDNAEQNPLNKIATIELQEAARAEKERRAMATIVMRRESTLVAKRPAPQPPNMTAEEALKRSVSVRRKEVASVFSPPAMPIANLQPMAMSSTTSAQLSPGVEEIRRRSPRQLPQDYQEPDIPQRPVSPSRPVEPPYPLSPVEQLAREPLQMRPAAQPVGPPKVVEVPRAKTPPQPVAVKTTIRPSRKLASPKKEPAPEPSKTPLQRRPTAGLPPGPRAQKMTVANMNLAKEAGAQAQQTVMFVNNIVYDDPNGVQRIIDGAASDRASKMPPGVPASPETTRSVVNRPRPIKRKLAEPTVEEARNHRRSRSGGSLINRKSILRSEAGSPTQLPPLPPPPKSAGNMPTGSRPQPNDTKSMTVDEKMGMFFPVPPSSGKSGMSNPMAPPDMPSVPRAFLASSSSPTTTDDDHNRSNRTTKTSVRTENLFEVDEILPPRREQQQQQPNMSAFSPETMHGFADDVGRSWLPAISDSSFRQTQTSQGSSRSGVGKRGSSPVLPVSEPAWTETMDGRMRDDASTMKWDSVYSPEVAVGVRVAPQVAKATVFQKGDGRSQNGKRPPSVVDDRTAEVIDIMLDEGFGREPEERDTWLAGDESMLRSERASQWHRRVGDDCPSFSARKEKVRSRKMPPPTPLLLNAGSNKNAVIMHAAEPSPLESPEHALQQIQAQLRKFEQPNRDSVESQGQARLTLLENLEKEMGLQENHWHDMQHDLGRDSLSSVRTNSPGKSSRRESTVAASAPVNVISLRDAPATNRASIAQERRLSRRSRMRSGSVVTKPADETLQLLQASDNSMTGAGSWQQKLALAEAEMEFMDRDRGTNPDRLSVHKFNFLTVSKARLGSPTPPDSDQSDEEVQPEIMVARPMHLDAVVAQTQATRGQPHRMAKTLWVPTTTNIPDRRSTSLLWTPPTNKLVENEQELPNLSVRPAQRKESALLPIQSTRLWRKPQHKTRTSTGLWRPNWASTTTATATTTETQRSSRPTSITSQSQKAPRPLTQRPPRRNKRVTLLPDIIEDPQPLPDKRGTLGIFQFPWGERSDTAAFMQPVRSTMVMAMPGTMTSGSSAALEARARQLEAAEYESSFFDDYDDEEEGEDEDGEESDGDDFDETTLWEIASLLKTDQIPSKNSMFPPPLEREDEVVDDFMGDIPFDGGEKSAGLQEDIVIAIEEVEEEDMPEKESTESTTLWQGGERMAEKVEPAVTESDSLQTPDNKDTDLSAPAWHGGAKSTKIPRPAEIKQARKNRKHLSLGGSGLWTQSTTHSESGRSNGLFKVDPKRTEYRTTTAEPAAKNIPRKPTQAGNKPLEKLTSVALWTKTYQNRKARFQYMSHGMWSPPLICEHVESPGLFTVDRTRDYRTTIKEPAAKTMERKPRPTEHSPLPSLASTNLWTSKPRQSRDTNWILSPSKSATRLQRPSATKADWALALRQALKASYPLVRRHATPEEWSSALAEALALSSRRPFNPATHHPVFAASDMVTESASFHPAATGYTHDIAAVHPAFFGSLTLTCPPDQVHPAMTSYAAQQVQMQLEEQEKAEILRRQIEAMEEEWLFVQRKAEELYSMRAVVPPSPVDEPRVGRSVVADEDEGKKQRLERSRGRREKAREREFEKEAKRKEILGRIRDIGRAELVPEEEVDILAQIRAIEESAAVDTFQGRKEKVVEVVPLKRAEGVVVEEKKKEGAPKGIVFRY